MGEKNIPRYTNRPPLSGIDIALYIVLICTGFVAMILFMVFFAMVLPQAIAFSRNGVIAADVSTWSVLCPMPFSMALGMVLVIPASYGLKYRQPLFRKPSGKHSLITDCTPVYPIVGKDFWVKLFPIYFPIVRRPIFIGGIVLLVSILIFPWGLLQSHALTDDGVLSTYDSFGRVTHTTTMAEADRLVISVSSSQRRGNESHNVALTFEDEGNEYRFFIRSFRDTDNESALTQMLVLKEAMNGRYEIRDTNKLGDLLSDKNYTPKERELIFDLFDHDSN